MSSKKTNSSGEELFAEISMIYSNVDKDHIGYNLFIMQIAGLDEEEKQDLSNAAHAMYMAIKNVTNMTADTDEQIYS